MAVQAPIVSVIMSVYRAELAWLKQAVSSILNQSLTEFEFLIYNDGAAENITKYLHSIDDQRVKIVGDGTNKGLAARLNEGLAAATGKYIARMDADDISHPTRLEQQVAFMEQNPHLTASSCAYRLLPSQKIVMLPTNTQHCRDTLWFTSPLCHPATIMRRSIISDLNLRYPDVPCAQDYGLWLQLAETSQLSNLKQPLLDYRQHGDSITHRSFSKKMAVLQQLQKPLLTKLLHREPTKAEQWAHSLSGTPQRPATLAEWQTLLRWVITLLTKLPSIYAKTFALKFLLRKLLNR